MLNIGSHPAVRGFFVFLTMVAGAPAMASSVDTYEMTVSGTFQSWVRDQTGSLLRTDSAWTPFTGDTVELVFRMPLPRPEPAPGTTHTVDYGTAQMSHNGTLLNGPAGGGYTTFQTSDNLTNNIVLFYGGILDRYAFSGLSFSQNIDVAALMYDLDKSGTINGLPDAALFDDFETQFIRLTGTRRSSFGRTSRSYAYLSIDSIAVTGLPPAVPLPASALLLGFGVAGLGCLRRRGRKSGAAFVA